MPAETIDAPPVADIPESTATILPAFSASMDKLFNPDGSRKDAPPAQPAIPPVEPKPGDKPPEVPPVVPDPKAKVDDKEEEMPAEIKAPKARDAWKKLETAKKEIEKERNSLRTEKEKLNGEVEQLRKDIEAAKKASPGVKFDELPEYKALKAEHDRITGEMEEYSKQLRIAEVTRHPKFKAHFDGRVQAAMDYAKKIGGDKAVELLKMPESQWRTEQLSELASELGLVNGNLLVNTMHDIAKINSEREQAIAAEEANWKSMKEQESVKAQQHKQSLAQTFIDVMADVTSKDKGLPVFQERDGDAEWNKGVIERRALAQAIYDGDMKPADLARAAAWSAAAPALMQALKGEQEARAASEKVLNDKIATYEAEITKLRAGTPKPGEGDDNATTPPTEPNGVKGMVDDMEKRGLFAR